MEEGERAASAAEALVELYADRDLTPRDRLPRLLERTILRGMRWAFGQSEQAVAQNRGAWVDAALTPFLAIADVRTRHPPL